jgi:starch synthase (maltosyl-transferring)
MQQTDDGRAAPRIYYLDLLSAGPLDELGRAFARAADLGFDHVVLPPVFAPARDGEFFLVADFTRLHPAIGDGPAMPGVRRIAEQATRAGLRVLIDLVPDRLAAGGAAAAAAADLFIAPPSGAALDPRQGGGRLTEAVASVTDAADAGRLADFWVPHLAEWHDAGLAGVRILGLARMPAAGALIQRLRLAAPDLTLIGWTPGMAWQALAGLVGSGLDFVVSSLAWWDGRGDWIWDEWALLRRIAPVLACPEAPFEPRLALRAAGMGQEAAVRRALRLAGLLGDGWLLPAGVDQGASETMPLRIATPASAAPLTPAFAPFADVVREINAGFAKAGVQTAPELLTTADSPVLAVRRGGGTPATPTLILANTSLAQPQTQDLALLLPRIACASLSPLTGSTPLRVGSLLTLAPGEVLALSGAPLAAPRVDAAVTAESARQAAAQPRVAIEAVTPSVEHGRYPAKLLAGTVVDIEADLICDGHDKIAARLLWREPDSATWQSAPMRLLANDRWTGRLPLNAIGIVHFAVEAWRDRFASFRDELAKKHAAGVPTGLELQEGRALLAAAAERGAAAVLPLLVGFVAATPDEQRALLLDDATFAVMRDADDRPGAARSIDYPLRAERLAAGFASWYEIFPRSMSDDPRRHGTFQDVIRHLPRIRDMGFDVLYFPPIHPIGKTNRKGRNNSLTPGPDDPGSPYAIGADAGGHDAIHPELGTIEDFRALRAAAAGHGLELALDFAIQCSPDHPWLRDHHGWFDWRPDGSIRYAENPPKKYEDIVNVDFYTDDAVPGLWLALAEIVLFWASEGVRLFRVDNPHTKPLPFWEWLIATVQARYPDALFLAEAFTRPKVMYRLGKIGFSQSYTYFTWRNTPAELRDYVTELTTTAPRDFFRPHFFVNTPDINPEFLHNSGRAGFLIRAALAATLSGLWGVYNGFELCEARPLAPGKEDYLDSEKYEIRAWEWDRPGNIVADITRLNHLRRTNPALQSHLGVTFLPASNRTVLYYEKATPDRSNVILVAVSFDPFQTQESGIELPLWRWSLPDQAALEAQDLTTDQRFTWYGKQQRITLTPDAPYRIWRVRPA